MAVIDEIYGECIPAYKILTHIRKQPDFLNDYTGIALSITDVTWSLPRLNANIPESDPELTITDDKLQAIHEHSKELFKEKMINGRFWALAYTTFDNPALKFSATLYLT